MSEQSVDHDQTTSPVLRAGDRRSLSRSATRALDVLEYFGQVRRPLRAIEIARTLSLHPSTVKQLLKTMVESAHLTFDAGPKTYLPSPRLTRFSSWMVDVYGSDERLRGMIANVHDHSHEIVTLTTPNDAFMQVIDLAGVDFAKDGTESAGAERGLRVPMFRSVVGAAYLSTLPAAEVRRLADRARIAEAEQAELLQLLKQIRADGYADGPSASGSMWSIAVPLAGISFSVPLVLGLSGSTERVRAKVGALSALMMAGAARLARKDSPD